MPCDDCVVLRQELAEARNARAHVEQVVADRQSRRHETDLMNKMLHLEISRLQQELADLKAELAWRNTDG